MGVSNFYFITRRSVRSVRNFFFLTQLILALSFWEAKAQYITRVSGNNCVGSENVFTFSQTNCSSNWSVGGGNYTIISQTSTSIRVKWNQPTSSAYVFIGFYACGSPCCGSEYYYLPISNFDATLGLTPSGYIKIKSTDTQTITSTPSVPPGIGGFSYNWFRDGVSIGNNSYTLGTNLPGIYKNSVSIQGCIKDTPSLRVDVNKLPTVNAGLDRSILLPLSTVTIVGLSSDDGSISSFAWSQISGPGTATLSGQNTSTLVTSGLVSGSYTFRFKATDDSGESSIDDVVVNVVYPQNNFNWISNTAILIPGIKTPSDVQNLQSQNKNAIVQYFDGLGRPMQMVSTQASPSSKDIVQPIVYDNFGRESKKYLPVVTNTTDGWYKPNLIDNSTGNYSGLAATNGYNNGLADRIADDSRPYSETIFEASPLNRPSKSYGVGFDWSASGSNKYIQHDYLINQHGTGISPASEKVVAWSLNATGMPIRTTPLATYIETGGYYSNGQLSIKGTIDEQGNAVREYTNKEGQVILRKVQVTTAGLTNLNSTTDWALTYYLYDDFGNLRYVFQPELSRTIHADNTHVYVPTATDLTNFAFQYKYDARKRMVEKRVPGSDWVYMVYDNRDRLVLTQDGNQRTPKQWTFTKYDALNRPILTGIYTHGTVVTQAAMQTVVDSYYTTNPTSWSESYSPTGLIHGYSKVSFPQVTDPNLYLTVTYYDNYSFRNSWLGSYTYLSDGLSNASLTGTYTQVATGSENQRVVGQATGSKVKVLDGGTTGGYTWLKSINYFDDKYRVIQTQSDNYKGGVDRISNLYDFSGKVLKTKTTHFAQDVIWKDLVGVQVIGNKLISTGSGWGNSGAASEQVLPAGQSGWVEVTASEAGTLRMIGLSDVNINANYNTIDYAIYLSAGSLSAIENGLSKPTTSTSYVAGDVLRVERVGTTVYYKKNGQTIATSSTPSSTSLVVDVAFYTAGSGNTLVNARVSFGSLGKSITRTLEYDHAGRPTKTWHDIDNGTPLLLIKNEYNEIGQLVDKKLHSTVSSATDNKQSVDYRYNIRGWLTSMNNASLANDGTTNDDTGDYFGMNLAYNTTDLGVGNSGLYNGNISGMTWSNNLGLGTIKQKAYTFSYDAMNRLKGSFFKEKTTSWSEPSNNGFDERGFGYDLNGNISKLTRFDKQVTGFMDTLAYNYGTGSNQSNKLLSVTDYGNDFKGFVDGTNAGDDYTYDLNGNLTRDLNKGLGTSLTDPANIITYNYLNLPETVTKAGNTIRYIYDATGRKLSQVVSTGTAQKQTDYVGEFTYENDALQFISHEEGRIMMAGTKLIAADQGESITTMTAYNTAATTTVTQNGTEKYIKITATGVTPRSGVFPIGTSYPVVAGERYRVRVKGYRTGTKDAYLLIKANATDLDWPGAKLPSNVTSESWVEQIVTIPTGATSLQAGVVWDVTLNAEIMYINEFEIAKLEISTPEYQYNLKDHLGNVRLTFTAKTPTTLNYTAGFETANQTAESDLFQGSYPPGGEISTLASNARTGSNSELLNGGYSGQVGVAKSFAVMPGDQVQIQAYAKYSTPTTTATNYTSFVASLLSAFNLPTPGVGEVGTASAGVNTFGNWEIGPSGDPSKTDPVKVFVTIILFDKNYNFIDVAYKSSSATGALMSQSYTIKEAGYAYLYVSNEHPTLVNVYIDDVTISHTPSAIVQMNDYYAFGLTFNSYQRENGTANQYLYNGKEQQDELGLGWYDYIARQYDPAIGRFLAVDPAAEAVRRWSTYSYAADNPIRFIDPDGMLFTDFIDEDGNKTHVEDGSNAVFEIKKDANGFDQRKHYEFKEYDESQGGKNETNVETVIQEQQNYNLANEDLQQESDGTTYCNYATQNIMDAVGSATGKDITITGRGNDMAEKLQTDKRYKSVDQATAETTAAEGGLAVIAFRNFETRKDGSVRSGHLATFSVGDNIAKGKAANIGTAAYTGFQPEASSFFKAKDFATVKFYILKSNPQMQAPAVKQTVTKLSGICD